MAFKTIRQPANNESVDSDRPKVDWEALNKYVVETAKLLRRKSMTKPLTTLIFCTLLAACATQPKQGKVVYSDNEVVYPYHLDGVNCYGLLDGLAQVVLDGFIPPNKLLCLTTQTPASLAEPLRINYAKHGIGLKR